MENLYHIVYINNRDSSRWSIRKILEGKDILWDPINEIGNGPAFNIFECKRLVKLAKQYDRTHFPKGLFSYEIIPATKKE